MSKARFSGGKLMNVILERFPYRYVECGTLENGYPDYRIQKFNELTQSCLLYTPRIMTVVKLAHLR